MRKKILALALGLLLVIILLWAMGQSKISIQVSDAAAGEKLSYNLQSVGKDPTTFTSSETSVTKSVSRGNYQVTVRQGETSYTAAVTARGWFGKTNVAAALKPEYGRTVVGANPNFCMNYIGDRLISSECGSDFSDVSVHVPGTARQPQYVTKSPLSPPILGTSEGVVETAFGTVAVTRLRFVDENLYGHYVYPISQNLVAGTATKIEGLDPDTTYTIKSYKQGFLAYDSDLKNFYYVASLSTPAKRIPLGASENKDFKPLVATVQNQSISILYGPGGRTSDTDEVVDPLEDGGAIDMEVAVIEDDQQNRYAVHGAYSAGMACGISKLCLQGKDEVDVYSISKGKARLSYAIPDVQYTEVAGKQLLFFSKQAALSFDVDSKEGFYVYTYGDYNYCGVSATQTSYVLCIGDERVGKFALLMDPGSTSDGIDKKVLRIAKDIGVKDVSVYRNFVYVVPDYGETAYNPTLRAYTYDVDTKRTTDQRLASLFTRIGLPNGKYTFINTGL
jgi:hypothetical protein